MSAIFEKKQLTVLLQDFHRLTGLRAAAFDAHGAEFLSYPPELPAYCRLIRSAPGGAAGCRHCDLAACRKAIQQKESLIYACHAGLIEVITPVLIEDAVVGFLLLSHIVQGEDEEAEWQYASECCRPFHLEEDALKQAYSQLQRIPYPKLKSAADLLALAASALYQKGMARLAPGSPQALLTQYLTDHLAENLSSEAICKALSLSRTGLYHLSCQTYGCGVKEQLTRMRVQKAMDLLATTTLSHWEICQQTGFGDYNYFYRVFRSQTGLTPRQYRISTISEEPEKV